MDVIKCEAEERERIRLENERLKAEAKREHATMYEVIEDALDARQRLATITAAINPQVAHTEAA